MYKPYMSHIYGSRQFTKQINYLKSTVHHITYQLHVTAVDINITVAQSKNLINKHYKILYSIIMG